MLIKIKVPGEGTIAEQPPTNRGPKGDNRGRVLCYPMPCCTENAIHISKYTDGYASHKPAQRSIQTEWHTGATCKWARGMAWASDYIGGFLNRLTIADFSIKYGNHVGQKSNSTASCARDMVVGPSPLHSLLSSGYGDRVQAQSTSTGACDLQFASRHGSIRSWQRGRQAGEGEEEKARHLC